MPTTTASDDDNLLDTIEQQLMHHDMSVTMQCIWLNTGRPDAWQISLKMDAVSQAGDGTVFCTGGGCTLREALQNAVTSIVAKRLTR